MPSPMRESQIEKYLAKRCKQESIYCRKWASPGQRGVPDRILLHKGKWYAVELKAPGKKPTKLQLHEHVTIRKHDGLVYVIDSKEDVDFFLDRIVSGSV